MERTRIPRILLRFRNQESRKHSGDKGGRRAKKGKNSV